MADAGTPQEGRQDGADDVMGGTDWEGVPAGTSGSAAPGTEGAGEGRPSAPPEGQRPTRRGHEDVGDASGELGTVGKPTSRDTPEDGTGEPVDSPAGRQDTHPADGAEDENLREAPDAPADAGLGANARGRTRGQATGVGPQATAGPGRAAGERSSTGVAGVGDQRDHRPTEDDPDG